MRTGLSVGYWGAGPPRSAPRRIAEAEALGVDGFWTAEAYGSDALTPLAWWGAGTERMMILAGWPRAEVRERTLDAVRG